MPLCPPEFLQSRVEVSVLGILTGGAVGFISLLALSLAVLYLLHKNKAKAVDEPVEIIMQKKRIELPTVKVDKRNLPRENMSLPSNIQLNDLNTLWKARDVTRHLAEVRGEEDEDEDLSTAYAARGFARYPMVGYIYKVNSVSSDEIWL
ncbi:hypothetical protein UPYG_G00194410 [Umbra pygmaea]|uniref:Uncharacterized protein n=1 Tax=Umbra pygmaea TaxID=75934 RepID=A0ABD0X7C8_UMBPY